MEGWRDRIASCGDDVLAGALIQAIEELFERDLHPLRVQANENTISALLRSHLLGRVGCGPDGQPWDVDFDYNRRQASIKTVHGKRRVRPDIIVHRRDSDMNLLALELKKGSSVKPDDDDLDKLQAYRLPVDAGGLGYTYALFLRLGAGDAAGTISCVHWA